MRLRMFTTALCAAVLTTSMASAAEEKASLTFALVQTQEMSVLSDQWDEALTYVSEQVGADISFFATTSYSSVIESMLSDFVDFAKLGPNAYILATKHSGGKIVPIVATARGATMFYDQPCACYFGTLITKRGSGLDTIESLKGKTVALVDPASTSGNALPRALFPEAAGVEDIEDFFGEVFYSGSHSASALAVYSGRADAAFVSETTLERVIEEGKMANDDLNYLWRSPKIASDVIVVNTATVSPEKLQSLRNAFVNMIETEAGKSVLEQTGYAAFVPAEDSDYDPIRKILAYKEKTGETKN